MIVARPADWAEGDLARVDTVVEAFVANPTFTTYPWPAEERRASVRQTLSSPMNLVFEAWKDGAFCGILLLEQVIPFVDAKFHFLFTDHDLVGKRKLLVNFLGTCFTEMRFHRISMEVPDGLKLEKFARKALGFRYEGEGRERYAKLPKTFTEDWLAKQGSRRTEAHFDGEVWRDIVLLRLLASDWQARFGTE